MPCAALLLAAVAWSCHPVVSVPAPELEDAQSILLVVTSELGEVRAVAADLGDPPALPTLALAEGEALHAFTFACPLARVGLQAGPQALTATPQEASLLPPAVRAATWAPGDAGWTPLGEPPAAVQDGLRRLPLDAAGRCRARQGRLVRLDAALPNDGHQEAAFLLSLPDDTALVASRNGFYYKVYPDGSSERLPPLSDVDPLAALLHDDGTLWLLDQAGQLTRGPLLGPRTVVATAANFFPPETTVHLSGPTDPSAPFELFAVSASVRVDDQAVRTLARFDNRGWRALADASPRGLVLPFGLWRGPGQVAAAGFGDRGRSLLEYAGSQTSSTSFEGTGAVGLIETPELGLVVGLDDGRVVRRAGGSFTPLGATDFEGYAFLFTPLPQGALLVGGLTRRRAFEFGLAQWIPGLGFCPAEVQPQVGFAIARVDARTWVMASVTSLTTRQAFDILLVRLETDPEPCQPPKR